MVPVSRFIRSVGSAIGQALAPAASWVFNNVLAPVGRGIATAAIASYQYVIAPVASALGSAAKRRKWHCGSVADRCSNHFSGLR